jgi:molybdate/tungstate transport system permease protein
MRTKRYLPIIVMLAIALVASLFVILPLVSLVSYATLAGLTSAFSDPAVQLSMYLTMVAGGMASAISVVLGVPAGYVLARTSGFPSKLLSSILELPIMIPHFVVGIALLLFAPFVFQSLLGVVAVMVFVGFSYTVKAAESSFVEMGAGFERAALTLGASPFRAFRSVSLPLSARSIAGGALLSWARGIGEMGAFLVLAYYVYPVFPLLPTATNPMSIYAYQVYQLEGIRGAASVSLVYISVSLAIFLVTKYVHHWKDLLITSTRI